MRNRKTARLALLSVCLVIGMSGMQAEPQQHSLTLSRVNFEVAVRYEAVANVTIGCVAKDFNATADWGDGTPSEILSYNPRRGPGEVIPPGTYPVFSTHRYTGSGRYTVTTTLWVRCSGAAESARSQQKSDVQIFDRVPLATFTTSHKAVSRGGMIELHLTLASPAPPSQTRILIDTDSPEVLLGHPFPRFIDFPANSDHFVLRATTRRQARPGRVSFTATSVNGIRTVAVELQ